MQHALVTGPIQGLVTLQDGTVVNVNPDVIEVTGQDQADEIAFLIGEHWVRHGHPHDIDEEEDEDGNVVYIQRPFVHAHHPKFDKHPGKHKGKPAGTPHQKG
jgi:hypothetical protein